MRALPAVHQGDGHTVRELGEESDHLVMLSRAQHRDLRESEQSGEFPERRNPLPAVSFRGGYYEIGIPEDTPVTVLHAAELPARHGMCRHKLHPGAKQVLDASDQASLDAGDIGDKGSGPYAAAVFPDPGFKIVGIEREHYQVEGSDVLRTDGSLSVPYDSPAQCGIYRGTVPVNTAELEAGGGKRIGIRASDQAHADYKNLLFGSQESHRPTGIAPEASRCRSGGRAGRREPRPQGSLPQGIFSLLSQGRGGPLSAVRSPVL